MHISSVIVSINDSIDSILGSITENPSFYGELIEYCAVDSNYEIYLQSSNQNICKIQEINDAFNNI